MHWSIFSLQAEKDILIGNAQRSMHIENDEHMYIGSPCLCLSKNLYEKFGRRSFAPDHIKGDTCESILTMQRSKEFH